MRTSRLLLGFALLSISFPALAAAPQHFWSRGVNAGSWTDVTSIAVVPSNGDIIATGYFTGTVDFGTGPISSASNSQDTFLVRFDERGHPRWVKTFGSTGSDFGVVVVVDASGNIFMAAGFDGFANFGGGDLFGSVDFAIAKYDPAGNHVWSYKYGGSDLDYARGLAVDGSGNVLVCGTFAATADLGGPDVTGAGFGDLFVAKYNAAGQWQWNVVGGGAGLDQMFGITTDAAGNVYATGYFEQTLTFTDFPTPLVSAGDTDMILLKIGPAGNILFYQRRGGTGEEVPLALCSNASGTVVVTGAFKGTTNLGGGSLASLGGYDVFLARYTSSGAYSFSFRHGGIGDDIGYDVRYDPTGNLLVTGHHSSPIDLGGGPLPHAGGTDIFLAKFNTAKQHIWSRGFGGMGDDVGRSVAEWSDRQIVAGTFKLVANLGGEDLVGNDKSAGFIAKYGPAEPDIASISDIGNDQGRSVRITVARSPMDDGTADLPITEYRAYRRVLPLPAAFRDRVSSADPPGLWEQVSTVAATNATNYRLIAPTLADSTETQGQYYSKFFVRAATSNPSVYFDSPVDSGYSVDNLAPGIPANFSYLAGQLAWDESGAADFDYFTVYGANTFSFAAATLVDYSVAPAMDVNASPYVYYFVTATDFSGNEGKPAAVTTLSNAGTPKHYVLSISAYPNPFNPETTIRYTLPSRERVSVAVFNAAGQRVATLVDTEQESGPHTIAWNGRSDAGAPVGSGVYFARLSSQSGERSYKLTLLK